MTKKTGKKFPTEIFIKREIDGGDPDCSWLLAGESMMEFANVGTTETIAVYKLVEVRNVTGAVTFKTKKVVNG